MKHIINKRQCTDNDHWGSVAENGTVDDYFVYEDNTKVKIVAYIGKGGNVTIPEGATAIGKDTFSYCIIHKCLSVENVFLYSNPQNLIWTEKDCNDFKSSAKTKCRMLDEYLDQYETDFTSIVNLTFEGDIKEVSSNDIKISGISNVTYTGKGLEPIVVTDGDKILTPSIDYTIT